MVLHCCILGTLSLLMVQFWFIANIMLLAYSAVTLFGVQILIGATRD